MDTRLRASCFRSRAIAKRVALGLAMVSLAGAAWAAGDVAPCYKGQVLYLASKSPATGVLIELVEAAHDKPGGKVFAATRTDSEGRFTLEPEGKTAEKVAFVVWAVRLSGSSSNRRSRRYHIDAERRRLGFLVNPSPTKPNTVLIEHRQTGHTSSDHH